jgi:hypothetical protein
MAFFAQVIVAGVFGAGHANSRGFLFADAARERHARTIVMHREDGSGYLLVDSELCLMKILDQGQHGGTPGTPWKVATPV